MVSNLEKAQLLLAVARKKGNWGKSYDRLEHFKRFANLKAIIKELSKIGWIIVYNKPNFTVISLNPKCKREIIEFIEKEIPYMKGIIN